MGETSPTPPEVTDDADDLVSYPSLLKAGL